MIRFQRGIPAGQFILCDWDCRKENFISWRIKKQASGELELQANGFQNSYEMNVNDCAMVSP
jgi:hypothetical protein